MMIGVYPSENKIEIEWIGSSEIMASEGAASKIWKAASSPTRTSGLQKTTEVFTTQGVNTVYRDGYPSTYELVQTL